MRKKRKTKTAKATTPVSIFFGDRSLSKTISSIVWLAAVNTHKHSENKDVIIADLTGNITEQTFQGFYNFVERGITNCTLEDLPRRLSFCIATLIRRPTSTYYLRTMLSKAATKRSGLSLITNNFAKQKLIQQQVFDKLIEMLHDSGSIAIIDAGSGQTLERPMSHRNSQKILICKNTTESLNSLGFLAGQADKVIAVAGANDESFVLKVEEITGHQVSAIIPEIIEPVKNTSQDSADGSWNWKHMPWLGDISLLPNYNDNLALYSEHLENIILQEIGDPTASAAAFAGIYTEGNHNWDSMIENQLTITESHSRSFSQQEQLWTVRCAGITQHNIRCGKKVKINRTDNDTGVNLYNVGAPLCLHHKEQLSEEWVVAQDSESVFHKWLEKGGN